MKACSSILGPFALKGWNSNLPTEPQKGTKEIRCGSAQKLISSIDGNWWNDSKAHCSWNQWIWFFKGPLVKALSTLPYTDTASVMLSLIEGIYEWRFFRSCKTIWNHSPAIWRLLEWSSEVALMRPFATSSFGHIEILASSILVSNAPSQFGNLKPNKLLNTFSMISKQNALIIRLNYLRQPSNELAVVVRDHLRRMQVSLCDQTLQISCVRLMRMIS